MVDSGTFALLCAAAAAAVGVFGAFWTQNMWSGVGGVGFVLCFWQTLRLNRMCAASTCIQGLLVLTLVMLSFALHLLFLPAGICCFFAMISCKNELCVCLTPKRQFISLLIVVRSQTLACTPPCALQGSVDANWRHRCWLSRSLQCSARSLGLAPGMPAYACQDRNQILHPILYSAIDMPD